MDCGSKGCRFMSFFLPVNIFNLFSFYNTFVYNFKTLSIFYKNTFLNKIYFLSNYYILNELIWQEGFLIDFLQKKVADNWIKKFLIFSSYLFNERLVFDKVIRFYLDLIIWPMHKLFIFDVSNISSTLFITIFFFIFFLFFFTFFYFFLLMF